MAIIAYRNISKVYRRGPESVHALDRVSLEVEAGEFVTVVGRSGCGKTTLLKLTAGLIRPSAGEVVVNGHPVYNPITDIGVVFQSPVLLQWRRALDNVLLQIEMRKLDRRAYTARARELLRLVGLEGFEDKYPDELSGGMQQRVSITRALIHDPALLLMDEPFGALDALTREDMNLEVQRIWSQQRKTVLFITHSIPEAVFLGDRVVVMTPRPGRIAGIFPIDLPRPRSPRIREDPAFVTYVSKIRDALQ
ncbi:MAG: ABC transporter ATP-binding protein [Deltaproteobacteria bacterium]|nr:ABC transporter ATP-binding protein [Deltaproteobacteria bacterium]